MILILAGIAVGFFATIVIFAFAGRCLYRLIEHDCRRLQELLERFWPWANEQEEEK